jgi:hypothetical protein
MAQIHEPSGSIPKRFCEDVRRGIFDLHTSKANTRLTTGLIITPGFFRQTVVIRGILCTVTAAHLCLIIGGALHLALD